LLWQQLLGLLCKCACMVGMGFRATKRQKGFYLILFHFTCFLFLSNCSSSPFSHNRDYHKSCYKIPISAFSPFYFILFLQCWNQSFDWQSLGSQLRGRLL
jgi:hypothetical protein